MIKYTIPVPGVAGPVTRASRAHNKQFHHHFVAVWIAGDTCIATATTWHSRRDLAAHSSMFGRPPDQIVEILPEHMRITNPVRRELCDRNADRIDGYDRDDLGESPDY